jgi:small subunit ribosomal protein S16
MGAKKRPSYRLVVAHSASPRDGRFIETLGYYDPLTEPSTIKVDEEKALLWLSRGAQPTESAENLLKRQGILERFRQQKAAAKEGQTPQDGGPS